MLCPGEFGAAWAAVGGGAVLPGEFVVSFIGWRPSFFMGYCTHGQHPD